jgi:Asp-tRNA(Asn)/Glu-tRNA(Gln) amidotransferase A subunit family amidase
VAFKDALQCARELDQHLQETGGLIGPLHGIPVTLKDQFNLKDYDTTLGYVGRAFNPAAEDAVLVRILKDLGAVVLAKSNLPQSIMVTLTFLEFYFLRVARTEDVLIRNIVVRD